MSSTGSSDRAATAAWRLFEPMQFGMSSHPKLSPPAAHDLAENIAAAMCEMTDSAEMAMLWTEVCHTPPPPASLAPKGDSQRVAWVNLKASLVSCLAAKSFCVHVIPLDSCGSLHGKLCLGGTLMLLACLRVLRCIQQPAILIRVLPQAHCCKNLVESTLHCIKHRIQRSPCCPHLVGVEQVMTFKFYRAAQSSAL